MEPTARPAKSLALEYLEAFLIAVVFALFARTFVVQAFTIPSGSMEPTLLVGDHILVNKFIYGPTLSSLERALLPVREVRRGDVIVFRFPEDPSHDYVKRVVGLPGDVIKIVDKRLFVDGRPVADDSYVQHTDPLDVPRGAFFDPRRQRDNFGPYAVPPGGYFCLGDNRDNSRDSRFWRTVPESYLKGRALLIYWSYAGETPVVEWPGLGAKLRQIVDTALHFFSRTRWDRTFRIVR